MYNTASVFLDEEYLSPNDISELYKICPPPRPVDPSHLPARVNNGYIKMNNLEGNGKDTIFVY